MGRFDGGLPLAECSTARGGRLFVCAYTFAVIDQRRLGWSVHFRTPSGVRRVRGVDFGTEEHALGGVLSLGDAVISAARRGDERAKRAVHTSLFHGPCAFRRGDSQQKRDGHAAGGTAGGHMVAARKVVVAGTFCRWRYGSPLKTQRRSNP